MSATSVLGRCTKGDSRQSPVVLNLVLEAGELCDDALALFDLGRVAALRYGPVYIINGLGLQVLSSRISSL